MTATQWSTFQAYFATLGQNTQNPQDRIQLGRVRLDSQAYIAEALFDETTISEQAFERELARILGVQQSRINNVKSTISYNAGLSTLVLTFRNQTVAIVIIRVFGGWPINEQASHTECLGYLDANRALWNPPED
jgi:hypothetical protein